MNAER